MLHKVLYLRPSQLFVHKIKLAQAHNSPSTKPSTKINGMNWSYVDQEYSLQGKQD